MKDTYNIGELAKELKINKETIRYYEKIGLLSQPKRDLNGYREYSKDDIKKITFILIAKDYDFSLKEIVILLSTVYDDTMCENSDSIKRIVDIKINEINNKINDLENTRKLLQKVKENMLPQNKEFCYNIETFLKNNS